MLPAELQPDEDLTHLGRSHFQVLQKKQGFRFSMDAVLLAHFLQPPPGSAVLDIGTGCGVIPLLLLAQQPQLHIDGLEIQEDLAQMASRSMALNRVQQYIHISQGDVTALPPTANSRYDYIYSNPPFFSVGTGKISPLPQIALARHELACTLKQLLTHSARLLKPKGHLVLIHRAERLPELLELCRQFRLAPAQLRLIHPRLELPASLCLLEAVKGRQCTLNILPPLIIYDQQQQYTPEVQAYYQ